MTDVLTVTANPSLDRTYALAGVLAGGLNRAESVAVERARAESDHAEAAEPAPAPGEDQD